MAIKRQRPIRTHFPPIYLTKSPNPSQKVNEDIEALGKVPEWTIDKNQVFAILAVRHESLLERRTRVFSVEFTGAS
jgi:hypothetical protein